ncbi:MAG: type II secretion system protein, partial [Verrucomicrobia bacterium]|nr:type II secretion system protein [Verrucomicrobiota bacterium]
METTAQSKRITAFTLVELIVCIVCIVALLFVILPALVPLTPIRANNVACMGNLKQLGLAAREYALDNEERFPWGAPVSEGGTKELAELFLSDNLTP